MLSFRIVNFKHLHNVSTFLQPHSRTEEFVLWALRPKSPQIPSIHPNITFRKLQHIQISIPNLICQDKGTLKHSWLRNPKLRLFTTPIKYGRRLVQGQQLHLPPRLNLRPRFKVDQALPIILHAEIIVNMPHRLNHQLQATLRILATSKGPVF